ncbi:MAG: dockerin type I repeat-containing protein, partial [Prevotella sp.]|nr:dockerin type I repeat-containing protein [Prevotella sp.]
MMKRLLFCAVSALFAFSANAVEVGSYVYTPQGRFQITGETNLMGTAGSFANLDGWEVVTAGSSTMANNFEVGLDTATQVRYAKSLVDAAGEGMKYTTKVLDASTTYVISFKMRNAVAAAPTIPVTTSTTLTSIAGANLATVTGVGSENTVTYNRADELGTDWITYCYAIEGDGTARDLVISLTGMSTDVQITDIQIQQALKVADDRDAKEKADYILSVYNLTDWSKYDDEGADVYPAENLIKAYGQVAKITDDMKAYLADYGGYSDDEIAEMCPGFTNDYAQYTKQLAEYETNYNTFKQTQLTAYIDVTADGGEHLGYQSGYNQQKYTALGTWTVVSPSARGFWRKGWVDLGHYGGGNEFSTAELSKEFTLFQGGYTFKADMVAYQMWNTANNNYNTNYGLTSCDGFVYVTDADGNVIASSDSTGLETDVDFKWTTKSVAFVVPADGKYTMHIKANRRYTGKYGGQVYFRWPELYGKSFSEYSAEELAYVTAVQEQITAGDTAYAKADRYVTSEEYPWGKAGVTACLDSIFAMKEKYDALFTDTAAIVKTFNPDTYVNDPTKEESQMVYEVYTKYVKDLLATNRRIVALNDTLKSLGTKIAAATELSGLSIYSASTGKPALDEEIEKATALNTEMWAGEYSEENAALIVAEVAALEAAMETCKNSISSEYFGTTYADIDFEKTSELYDNLENYTEEGGAATIVGAVGSMEVTSFKKTTESGTAFPYEFGIDAEGGYKDLEGVLRVGGSNATVNLNTANLGQNIILISMDWWFGRLTDAQLGFQVLDEDGTRIAGLKFSQYNSSVVDYDTFGLGSDIGNFFVANTAGDAAFVADGNYTHWDVVLDYANMKQYIIAKTSKGTVYTTPVDINPDLTMPASFQITASGFKGFPARRSWFDNLKIRQVKFDATVKKGDVNKDGKVNIGDIISVCNFMAGDETITLDDADVNKDGKADIGDIITIANIMAGNND